MNRGLLIAALLLAPLAAWAQVKTSTWQTHRSDTTLREGMILRGHAGQAHLRIDTRPARAGQDSRLSSALASAKQLGGESLGAERGAGRDKLTKLVQLSTDVFPRGDAQMQSQYLDRVAKPAKPGRPISLERQADEGLAACRERAVALKMLLAQAGYPRARLRTGSYYRSTSTGPAYVSGHAWVELPMQNGQVTVLDPSQPPEQAIAQAKVTRGWIAQGAERKLRPYVAVGDHFLMFDEKLERKTKEGL